MKITILESNVLDGIPSASGIEKMNNKFWVIGDNSPWLFELNSAFDIIKKHPISSFDTIEGGIIQKKIKPDFEAITSIIWKGDSALFIFGSGSKYPQRNIGKLILLKDKVKVVNFDLTEFYEMVRDNAKLKEEDFNVEAAAIMDEKLYLFNRGKNKLIILNTLDFQSFLLGEVKSIKKIKSFPIDLPEIDGISAGFSGADADPENNRLVFTASVENTSNTVDDGEVLGSFVGIIDVDQLHHHYYPKCMVLEKNQEILPIKVESISIAHSEKNKVNCILVSDSDGGISELLLVEIFLQKE